MSDSVSKFNELMIEQLPLFIDMREAENQMLEAFKRANKNMTKNTDVKPNFKISNLDDKPYPYKSEVVNKLEKEYPIIANEFQEIMIAQYELFAAKMLSYGMGNISMGSNLETKDEVKFSLTSIWIRMNDKMNRLKNLVLLGNKNPLDNEPTMDSWVDLNNYGVKKIPESNRIKTTGCAEYGENFERPHFHLLVFNFDFPDKTFHMMRSNDWSDQEWPTYTSPLLSKLWPYGFHEIGTLTEESAAYVARYVTKKISGKKAEEHYDGRPPERLVCNSKGIGLRWLHQYKNEILRNDSVMWKHREMKMPRYYEKKLETLEPLRYVTLKENRKEAIKEIDLDSTKQRLLDRDECLKAKAQRLKRSL